MRRVWPLVLVACSYQPVRVAPDDESSDASQVPDATVDAFEPARDCPAEYDVALPGLTSRYRVITPAAPAVVHSDDCVDDKLGSTHLVAIDDQAELDALEALVDGTGNVAGNKAWVGGVQLRSQALPADGWLSVTGGPLRATFAVGEPNDVGNQEDNEENFVALSRGQQGLDDFGSNVGAVCECDGKPVAPEAAAAIDANR